MPNTIIIGISSGIGSAVAEHLSSKQHDIIGTYNNFRPELKSCKSIFLNLIDDESKLHFVKKIQSLNIMWDNLIVCPGTMKPIGDFKKINFNEWKKSFDLNFFSQLEILQMLLPLSNTKNNIPSVIFFAGGGTNSAPTGFSSYTTAKIGLIKMVEILDAEIKDIKFSIVGPGWVRTKIHNEVLEAENLAPHAVQETLRRLDANDFNPVVDVCECVEWLITTDKKQVGGRNFSSQHDNWRSDDIYVKLNAQHSMFKLRRYGNGQ